MIDNTTTPSRPLLEFTGVKLRVWPIVLAAILMQAMLWPAREAARWFFNHNLELFHHQIWIFFGLAESCQLAAGLAAVLVMRRVLPAAETYLRWPAERSLIRLATMIGVAMAAVMLLADYWPELIRHVAPPAKYEITAVGVPGWLFVMLAAGPTEEIIFRGVLVGMLTVLTPGRVRLGRLEIPISGVIVALLFGAAHYTSFFLYPLSQAIAQQTYAFIWGLIYVWLMEQSRSLLAPMIAHGVGDALEVGAVMLLSVLWR